MSRLSEVVVSIASVIEYRPFPSHGLTSPEPSTRPSAGASGLPTPQECLPTRCRAGAGWQGLVLGPADRGSRHPRSEDRRRAPRSPRQGFGATHGVIQGPDGAAWLTDGGQNAIVRVDPKTEEISLPLLENTGRRLSPAAIVRHGFTMPTAWNPLSLSHPERSFPQ